MSSLSLSHVSMTLMLKSSNGWGEIKVFIFTQKNYWNFYSEKNAFIQTCKSRKCEKKGLIEMPLCFAEGMGVSPRWTQWRTQLLSLKSKDNLEFGICLVPFIWNTLIKLLSCLWVWEFLSCRWVSCKTFHIEHFYFSQIIMYISTSSFL